MEQAPTVEPVAMPGGEEASCESRIEYIRGKDERKIVELPRKNMWSWSINSGHVKFSEGWALSLGFCIDELEPHVDQWKKLIHPEDLSRTIDAVGDYLSGKTKLYFCMNRLKMKDGSYRGNLHTGRVMKKEEGWPSIMGGSDLEII